MDNIRTCTADTINTLAADGQIGRLVADAAKQFEDLTGERANLKYPEHPGGYALQDLVAKVTGMAWEASHRASITCAQGAAKLLQRGGVRVRRARGGTLRWNMGDGDGIQVTWGAECLSSLRGADPLPRVTWEVREYRYGGSKWVRCGLWVGNDIAGSNLADLVDVLQNATH